MSQSDISVFIVDDDELVQALLEELLKSVGLKTESFSSARAFLETFKQHNNPCCLVSDIRMPGLSGLDLQDELIKRGLSIPIIFITGYGTVPMSVKAMKLGAVDFIQKPFENQDMLDTINLALEKNRKIKLEMEEISKIDQDLKSLTKREHEVLELIVNGTLNKVISSRLNMSESTVKTYRRRIMQKMEIRSLAELVRITEKHRKHSN